MVNEEWRPIPEWFGYEVSSEGRVRTWRKLGQARLLADAPRLLVEYPNKQGYISVRLNRNGGGRHVRVHRLVADAFLGPRPEGMETRHLDGDKTNNAVDNLKYGTRVENRRDRIEHGTDHNLRKTHCPQGHAYNEQNTFVDARGARVCRACRTANARRYRRQAAS